MASGSASSSSAQWRTISDLVELIQQRSNGGTDGSTSSYTLPSSEAILTTLQQRYKAELPYIYAGATNLVAVNPLRILPDLSDASATRYEQGSATAWEKKLGESENGMPNQPHPYELAGRIFTSMQRSGRSQAVVLKYV